MSDNEAVTLKMGIYRHYKGPLYQVLGLAHDANDATRTCVVYIGLQLDGAHLGPRLAVRTLEEFCGDVPAWTSGVSGLGLSKIQHSPGPRFTYLGPEVTAAMLAS